MPTLVEAGQRRVRAGRAGSRLPARRRRQRRRQCGTRGRGLRGWRRREPAAACGLPEASECRRRGARGRRRRAGRGRRRRCRGGGGRAFARRFVHEHRAVAPPALDESHFDRQARRVRGARVLVAHLAVLLHLVADLELRTVPARARRSPRRDRASAGTSRPSRVNVRGLPRSAAMITDSSVWVMASCSGGRRTSFTRCSRLVASSALSRNSAAELAPDVSPRPVGSPPLPRRSIPKPMSSGMRLSDLLSVHRPARRGVSAACRRSAATPIINATDNRRMAARCEVIPACYIT